MRLKRSQAHTGAVTLIQRFGSAANLIFIYGTSRIAVGPRARQKVASLPTLPRRAAQSIQTLCANAHGFGLHAAVRCGADQRKELEHLCRYITRPANANDRLKRNRAGQVVQLKSAYQDGTTQIGMSPLEFMQRLAALVRYCGGALTILAAIEDPPVMVRILSHLGLPTKAPPRSIRWRVTTPSYSKASWPASTACAVLPTTTFAPNFNRRRICERAGKIPESEVRRSAAPFAASTLMARSPKFPAPDAGV